MSVRVMSQVWTDYSIKTQSHLLVMLTLADYCDDNGFCWPSVANIAIKARLSERSVQYALGQLEQAGKITIEQRGNGVGFCATNRYQILGVQPLHPKGANGDREGCKAFAPDPSVEPSIEDPLVAKAWGDWKKHRSEKRCRLTPSTTKKQLELLDEWGPTRFVAAINNSIEKGYQGLFEAKTNGNCTTPTTYALKLAMDAKEQEAAELKRKYMSECADGNRWNDENARVKYIALRKEYKELRARISQSV